MENTSSVNRVAAFILNWLFLMILWLAFTSSLAIQELLVGVFTTALISIFTTKLFSCCDISILSPVKIFYIIYYLFVFLFALIKSNFDVARRVISPSLPINPGIVKFETKLTTEYAKMVLANSITLTPGTLSIDIIDNTFYIHWIDVQTTNPEEAFTEIAESFEKILLKIF